MGVRALSLSRRAFLASSAAVLGWRPAFAAKSADSLRFGLSGALDVIDPYYTGDREITIVVGELVFDTLIYRDPATFEHKPLLATAWRWLDDVTLEFDLRDGVTWHDGVRFSAADVVYTFDYITAPANRVSVPQYASWIKSTEAVDRLRVRVHLKTPFGPAPEYICQVLPILPKDFFGPGGVAGGNGRLVGTGPYKITEFAPGKGASFARNENYFAASPKGRPAIAKMAFRNIPDPATQMAELLGGGLDWIWRMPADQAEQLASAPGLAVARGGTMRIFWVGLETRSGLFADVRVRQAVAHAIDRAALVKNLLGEGTPLLDTPCYPAQFGCIAADQLSHYPYDPARAKALLKEAGFPNGVSTRLSIYRQSPDRMLAEAIQGDLSAVGLRTELNVTTLKAYYDDVAQQKIPMVLESYGQYGINDASIFLNVLYGGGTQDSNHDPQVMDLVRQAGQTGDDQKRLAIYAQAERRIMEQCLEVPLFIQTVNYAFAQDLDFRAWPDENPRLYLTRWK